MRRLYWYLRSWATLAWDCCTIGPRAAWEYYMIASVVARIYNDWQESEGRHE